MFHCQCVWMPFSKSTFCHLKQLCVHCNWFSDLTVVSIRFRKPNTDAQHIHVLGSAHFCFTFDRLLKVLNRFGPSTRSFQKCCKLERSSQSPSAMLAETRNEVRQCAFLNFRHWIIRVSTNWRKELNKKKVEWMRTIVIRNSRIKSIEIVLTKIGKPHHDSCCNAHLTVWFQHIHVSDCCSQSEHSVGSVLYSLTSNTFVKQVAGFRFSVQTILFCESKGLLVSNKKQKKKQKTSTFQLKLNRTNKM